MIWLFLFSNVLKYITNNLVDFTCLSRETHICSIQDININNKMSSLMLHAGLQGSVHCRKNLHNLRNWVMDLSCNIATFLSYMDRRRKHFIVEISLTLVSDDYVIFCVISDSIFYFDSICIIIKFKPINVASCHHVTLINLFTRGESHANFQITFFFGKTK